MTDPPRLLHRRSELGYTDRPAVALPNEPEAVSPEVQRGLTAQAALRARRADRASWLRARELLLAGIAELHRLPGTVDDRRVLARQVDRLEHKLGR
jgi:hypothetical protein